MVGIPETLSLEQCICEARVQCHPTIYMMLRIPYIELEDGQRKEKRGGGEKQVALLTNYGDKPASAFADYDEHRRRTTERLLA